MSQGPLPIRINDALAGLTFLAQRTPTTTSDDSADAFKMLTSYRDGGVFVGHWAGASEWERHLAGEELVMVLEGETTIIFLIEGAEVPAPLRQGELVLVPKGTWHRFTTPDSVKILSVTPQPTDHRAVRPSEANGDPA